MIKYRYLPFSWGKAKYQGKAPVKESKQQRITEIGNYVVDEVNARYVRERGEKKLKLKLMTIREIKIENKSKRDVSRRIEQRRKVEEKEGRGKKEKERERVNIMGRTFLLFIT